MAVIPKVSSLNSLTAAVFHILLALAARERHGYDIMRQVHADSGNCFAMGPGTLYGSLERMLTDGLIQESHAHPAERRRRYYRLTTLGRDQLVAELRRYATVAKIAKERQLAAKGMSFD